MAPPSLGDLFGDGFVGAYDDIDPDADDNEGAHNFNDATGDATSFAETGFEEKYGEVEDVYGNDNCCDDDNVDSEPQHRTHSNSVLRGAYKTYCAHSTGVVAEQEVTPLTPFRPKDILIRCSLTGLIFLPRFSANSRARDVRADLHDWAIASLSGMN